MDSPTAIETDVARRVANWFEAGLPDIVGLSTAPGATLRCPSASNSHGDEVFAVFDDSADELRFLSEPIDVPDVLRLVLDLDDFSFKNRLAGWCLTSGCHYWQGACRLGHFVNQTSVSVRPASSHCAITETCRWRREHGAHVCAPCSGIRNLPVSLQLPTNENRPTDQYGHVKRDEDDSLRGCK